MEDLPHVLSGVLVRHSVGHQVQKFLELKGGGAFVEFVGDHQVEGLFA